MDMKKILQAVDSANTEVSSSEMQRLRNIVEGKGPLNRLTAAESITVDHYSAPRTTITSPVLNVQEDDRPSMIGKYFKQVEEEFLDSNLRHRVRASHLAERVSTKINELSTDTLASYKKKAGADAKKADAEGDFERGNKRFSGIVKATKKQFDNDAKKYEGYDGPNDAAQFAKPPQVPQVPAKDGMYGSWEFTTRKDGDRSATHPQYGTFVWDNSGAGGALRPITWSLPSNSIPGMSWVTDFVSGTHTLEYTLKLGASDLELNTKLHTKLDGTNPVGSVGLKGRGHEANITSANGKATVNSKDPDGKETSWDVPPESAGEVKQEGLDQLLALRNKIDEAIKQRLDPKCWKGKHKEGTKIKGGVRVNNCVPNESIEESKERCMQCGMTNCSCAPGKCKCKPIAGWIPNKGFKKAVDEAANAAQQAAIAIAKKKVGKK